MTRGRAIEWGKTLAVFGAIWLLSGLFIYQTSKPVSARADPPISVTALAPITCRAWWIDDRVQVFCVERKGVSE